ncbi:brain-specific angiogenesis inhibitor 1-associated protein 2-like protein 1b [Megalops cyprinoides]|uniref:brain-specific angiogenesis inhibitor 1-associated protein 2-like protein 1b n=1 Tax=Megalops cyprinoides TaxID=118141 RepID=UPI0018651E75|nr:brain-specific angiogenesis inhibitor 1-associated protein 2-like protein 1b [Megalops cyprinoides]XP_036408827.1 brain-specific angiogenesis inhibitor 1-associated protein 2-like protein 1b [Megalops cyprinoides]
MSRDPEEVSKLTESTYKNVMEQFNPGLRNLVTLGKNYEKAVAAMCLAGKVYFDAVSKIGENAAVSPVSRELGVVLMEISEVHKKIHTELEENYKRFHKEIIMELEKKTDMDVKYMNATFKRYQTEHKLKQDSLEKSQADLRKLRRKSQGKNSSKYESRESEYLETLSSRQVEMQKFVAEGCREALVEEKRRFCFLVDKHCGFSYQIAAFHDKAKEMMSVKLSNWEDKCGDATSVPESIVSMIEGLKTPVSVTPQPSPPTGQHSRNNSDSVNPPPAPPLKAHSSPLVSMFSQDVPTSPVMADHTSEVAHPNGSIADHSSNEESGMSRSVSVSSGLNTVKKPKVRTIFPHTAGNNNTLLSFDEGDILTLLIPDERDGWLYGELDRTRQRGWFPSSYCRLYTEPAANSREGTPEHSKSIINLTEQGPEEEEVEDQTDVLLPPPDYVDSPTSSVASLPLSPSPENSAPQANGTPKLPFLGGGNPFVGVKLRPTVTNDRSAPII